MNIKRTLLVGIGSPSGDDRVGWLVADRVAELRGGDDRIDIRTAASPLDLLDWLEGVERLVICDACRGLRRVGEVRRWSWPTKEIPAITWSGTHDLPLPAVLSLAQQLGSLPPTVVVWAIEGAIDVAADTMSTAVSAAIPEVVRRLTGELDDRSPRQEKACTNSR